LKIEKIRLDELEDFVNSKTFSAFEIVPISPARAKSYIENPNAEKNDIVLYLGYSGNLLVAFRSLFADVVNSNDKQIRFGWCSGNWVHPDYRRKGFSEQLLKEAYIDWNQKLMFTNYAPNSEKLYLKTNRFKAIYQFKGAKGYLFPKTRKLISASNKNLFFKVFFSAIDILINLFSSILLHFYKSRESSKVKFEAIGLPDVQCYNSVDANNVKRTFNRGREELKWIFQNPWISGKNDDTSKKYPFSSISDSFYYETVKLFTNNCYKGFFIFSVRKGNLKTLYFCLPGGFESDIVTFIKNYCKQNKIETVTIYKKEIANKLFDRKFPFLHVKRYGQKIYSTFEIEKNDGLAFQDGDGDVIFT
jgi:hypothetical protein